MSKQKISRSKNSAETPSESQLASRKKAKKVTSSAPKEENATIQPDASEVTGATGGGGAGGGGGGGGGAPTVVHGSGFAAALQKALKKTAGTDVAAAAAAATSAAADRAPVAGSTVPSKAKSTAAAAALAAAAARAPSALSPRESKQMQKIKREFKEQSHVVPDGSELPRERMLSKIATRGVVKLFNAVQTQQKLSEGSASGQGASTFLDMLRVRVGAASSAAAATAAAPASSTPSFLRDDYARSKLKGKL
jgi:hypothetical protein